MTPARLVAVLAAVLLSAAACGDGADRVATPSPSPSPSPYSPVPSPSSTGISSAEVDAVVGEFLGSLGTSGSRRAWDLLSGRSQEGFGSFAAFDDLATEYAEGLAAFAAVERRVTPLSRDLAVVTMSGEVTREGDTETDAYALPIRQEAGGPRVELLAPRIPLPVEIEVPARGAAAVDGDAELRAYVPAASLPTVLVDGDVRPADQTPADGDRTRVTLTPGLEPGAHVLTVTALRDDGLLLADATAFTVS